MQPTDVHTHTHTHSNAHTHILLHLYISMATLIMLVVFPKLASLGQFHFKFSLMTYLIISSILVFYYVQAINISTYKLHAQL